MEFTTTTPPAAAQNLLCASLNDTTGTLLAVPAGRTWVGEIVVCVSATHTVATTNQVTVATPNTAGVFPQNQVVARAGVTVPANGVDTVTATFKVTVINTTGSSINLTVAEVESVGGTTAKFVTANGVLL